MRFVDVAFEPETLGESTVICRKVFLSEYKWVQEYMTCYFLYQQLVTTERHADSLIKVYYSLSGMHATSLLSRLGGRDS